MERNEEDRLIAEMLAMMTEDVRAEMDDAARREGRSIQELLRMLLSDMERQGILEAARREDVSEDEFARMMLVGNCPNCGGGNTITCEEIDGIEDPTMAKCSDCGYSWCLVCGSLVTGETCIHWEFCEQCDEEKDDYGDCGISPDECPLLLEWLAENYARQFENACAWCGSEIGEGAHVFAVGAAVRGRIEFSTAGEDEGFLMPVMIQGRLVPAVVTAPGSEARKQGNDIMFMNCSEQCALALRDALREEKELIDRAELN